MAVAQVAEHKASNPNELDSNPEIKFLLFFSDFSMALLRMSEEDLDD